MVSLIIQERKVENPLYTLETILNPGQNTDAIRELIIRETGMAPGFYLSGTKVIVNHKAKFGVIEKDK